MPVEAQTVEYSYVGDGVTTGFQFPSRFLSNADLFVALDGVVQFSGFTITGAGTDSGGVVTFAVAPPSMMRVVLVRNPPPSQLIDFENGQTILEATLDNALDKLTMIVQYLLRALTRTLRLSDFASDTLPPLADASQRAQKLLGFDAAGAVALVPPIVYIPTAAVAGQVASRSLATAMSFDAQVTSLRLAGYATSGDGGAGDYVRVATQPASGGLRTLDRYVPDSSTPDPVNGGWWKPVGVITPAMYGGNASSAGQAAYANNCPLHIGSGAAAVSVDFSLTDGKANWAALVGYATWLSSCVVGPFASVDLVPSGIATYPLTVHDVKGDGRPALTLLSNSPWLRITKGAARTLNITSVTIGPAGQSHHPVYRTATQFPVTLGLSGALPADIIVGSAVYAQCVVGDVPDAILASGSHIVEWIANDRLSFRATIQTKKPGGPVSPGSITNGGLYQTVATSVLSLPQVSFIWDTEYLAGAQRSVTLIPNGAATVITAPGHGFANNALIQFGGTAPSQLLGRIFTINAVTTNTFNLCDVNNVNIDSTAYDTYTSGAFVQQVTEAWTGLAQEALFNVEANATFYGENIGFAWGGWLKGNTGLTADQDLLFARAGGNIFCEGMVGAGAGDKVIRTYGANNVYGNRSAVGGGGCQSAIYTQGGSAPQWVRGFVGHSVAPAWYGTGGCKPIGNGTIIVGSNSELFRVDEGASSPQLYPAILYGGEQGISVLGGRVLVTSATQIDGCATGLEGQKFGVIVGNPAFGTGNTSNSALLPDGVGGATSGKGGARWIQNAAGNQTPAKLQVGQTQEVAGLLEFTGAGRSSLSQTNETAPFGGTLNHTTQAGRVTISAPGTAAGGFEDITVNNPQVTSNLALVEAFVMGGTHTAGIPVAVVHSIATGVFVIRVYNAGGAAFSGGTIIVGYDIKT